MRRVLLIALMVVSALALFLAFQSAAQSQSDAAQPAGPFMISAYDRMVWRVDQSTGRVSYCQTNTASTDPRFIATQAPYCSAWSSN